MQRDQLLPCFLQATEDLLPRQDNSKMACPSTIRKPYQKLVQDCQGAGSAMLVSCGAFSKASSGFYLNIYHRDEAVSAAANGCLQTRLSCALLWHYKAVVKVVESSVTTIWNHWLYDAHKKQDS